MTAKATLTSRAANHSLLGSLRVPGDKSMSHRAVMFSSLAEGTSHVTGLLEGEDVMATLAAFRAMGVTAEGPDNGALTVHGVGMNGLQAPESDLDMGNSGTAMRLMAGILAAQRFASKLIGDESLTKRPMRRVTVPLTSMGARCATDDNGCPPIHIRGVEKLEPITYKLPMASAQIKSAVLLAGLYADGETSVTEPAPTRDHTERMLKAYGYQCQSEKVSDTVTTIRVKGGGKLTATDIDIPADISSAAFFMVAASIVPGSRLLLEHVCVNPTRTGIIDILKAMGADIKLINPRAVGGEPVADIQVSYVGLKGCEIDPELVPLAIDEFPVICIAAACAEGQTTVSGAEELRHKESDRISAMVEGMRAIGVDVEERRDGMLITGGKIAGGTVESYHDHRIAMSFAIAGAVSENGVLINGAETVATSFPNFVELANAAGLSIDD
ncbi:3-phosphoshikimate 1-carboxyvinyltransferase [Arenicella xantha]|uniref:3-phosphoshikimate 1-carboxyvinyltransferase n=1 Tax=Arenicella xantha TaxID=644221 RepID=A0A395JNW4_9GAMM|nr:3-phosphoshikimate 1-carboxyvinyltransferase [Arenicella xantha]RBP51477.1 3-phosphoshikimate 1-carboxyvinyltransferase [Arenicella xantha]